MMILIADSGSTKTDWTLLHSSVRQGGNVVVATFHTQGITPVHQTAGDIRQILTVELLPQLSTFPRSKLIELGLLESPLLQGMSVFFYGSGCTPDQVPMMSQLIAEVLSAKTVEVHSDLTAAARALCQHEAGIACILGTGANSCLYDGTQIVQNTPPLGYILGDEGSGAVLGRSFLNAIFKDPALADVRDEFLKANKMQMKDVIQRVYRQPMANRWLASLSSVTSRHPHVGGRQLPPLLASQRGALPPSRPARRLCGFCSQYLPATTRGGRLGRRFYHWPHLAEPYGGSPAVS